VLVHTDVTDVSEQAVVARCIATMIGDPSDLIVELWVAVRSPLRIGAFVDGKLYKGACGRDLHV